MEFYEVIKKRRSIRKFKADEVPKEVLKRILEAGRAAPSWANKQGVRYIIVSEPENRKKVAEAIGQKWTQSAPMFIIVFIDPKDSGKNTNGLEYYPVDAAIALEHIILAATAEGLGTCWIGYFNEKKLKEILELPKKVKIIGITPLGYPDGEPKQTTRKPLSELVYSEKYGNKWEE